MSQTLAASEVLTLQEAAEYLRLPELVVRRLVAQHDLPGRQIGAEWRFLRSALAEWLRGPNGKVTLLSQAGALANDPWLGQMLKQVYEDRGRPEVE